MSHRRSERASERARRPASSVPPDSGGRDVAAVAERVAQGLLVSLVLVLPWLLGSTNPFARRLMFLLAALSQLACLVSLVARREYNLRLPALLLPLAGGITLAVVQLVPWGAGVVQSLSPKAAALRSEFLPANDAEEFPLLPLEVATATVSSGPETRLSMFPASTMRELAMLVCAFNLVLVSAIVFREPDNLLWLCRVAAINGGLLSFIGIIQSLASPNEILWYYPRATTTIPFGPFIVHNSAAGYLNMCLAAALAWFVHEHARTPAAQTIPQEGWSGGTGKWRLALSQWTTGTVAVAMLSALIMAGILASLSRGGTLALIGGAVIAGVLQSRSQRRGPLIVLVVGAFGTLFLLGWVGMTEAVDQRLASLFDQAEKPDPRLPVWWEALRVGRDFALTGSGLGTWRFVYESYPDWNTQVWFTHPENQYLEAFTDGGVPALLCLAGALFCAAGAVYALHRRGMVVFALLAGFALASQCVSATFDFGLYHPANMVLLAVICGGCAGLMGNLAEPARWLSILPQARGVQTALTGFGLMAGLWGLVEVYRSEQLYELVRVGGTVGFDENSAEELEMSVGVKNLVELSDLLRSSFPDQAEVHARAAEWLIEGYRQAMYEQLLSELGETADRELAWSATTPILLHRRACQFAMRHDLTQLEELRKRPEVQTWLRRALQHLLLARRACPTFPKVHLRIGELCFIGADPMTYELHARRTVEAAPGNSLLEYRAGILYFNAERPDDAFQCWKKAVGWNMEHAVGVVQLASSRLGLSETLDRLGTLDPQILVKIGLTVYWTSRDRAERELLSERIRQLIGQYELTPAERDFVTGAAYAFRDEWSEADPNLERAIKAEADNEEWRFSWARFLLREGRLIDAQRQAQICVRMNPRRAQYRQFLLQLDKAVDQQLKRATGST